MSKHMSAAVMAGLEYSDHVRHVRQAEAELEAGAFWACQPCWREHSGVAPTMVGGRPFRPVAHFRTVERLCHFCGRMSVGVHRYEAQEVQ